MSMRIPGGVTVIVCAAGVAVLAGVFIWLTLDDGLMRCEMIASPLDGVERVIRVCR